MYIRIITQLWEKSPFLHTSLMAIIKSIYQEHLSASVFVRYSGGDAGARSSRQHDLLAPQDDVHMCGASQS